MHPPLTRTAAVAMCAAVVAGAALGIGTQVLQGVLPGGWSVLANSGVMWALAAFTLGACMPATRRAGVTLAAAGGAIELVVASCLYYAAVGWFEHSASNARSSIIWSCAGVVAGSVFGAVGQLARRQEWRGPAIALIAGTLAGEGARVAWFVGNPAVHWAGIVELTAAIVVGGTCVARRHGLLALGVIGAAAVLTLLAGSVIDHAFAA
ncbi:MAG: hypothetical protein JWL72_4888 [Ilumatobacteraceae bacterium]|nr:hypothetical protein [Ilumatobacteraceae bacterium]